MANRGVKSLLVAAFSLGTVFFSGNSFAQDKDANHNIEKEERTCPVSLADEFTRGVWPTYNGAPMG